MKVTDCTERQETGDRNTYGLLEVLELSKRVGRRGALKQGASPYDNQL